MVDGWEDGGWMNGGGAGDGGLHALLGVGWGNEGEATRLDQTDKYECFMQLQQPTLRSKVTFEKEHSTCSM